MSGHLLITFTTLLLENKDFLSSASIIEDSSLDYGSVHIRSADLDRSVRIHEQDFVKNQRRALLLRKAVYKNLHASLNLKLLACNLYYCVHK